MYLTKTLLLILSFNVLPAFADLESCLTDARDYGYYLNERRNLGCKKIISEHPGRIEVTGPSGLHKILAIGNILYLDTFKEKDAQAPIKSEILAGDQTDLRKIKKVWIHEKKNRILVLQATEPYGLLTYQLGNISNTAPLRHFISPILKGATSIKLLDDQDEIAIISAAGRNVRFINSDADTVRYKGGIFTPLLLRELKGEESQLREPKDVAISNPRSEIYVLDSSRILIFDAKPQKSIKPKRVLVNPRLKDGMALELKDEDKVTIRLSSGEEVKIAL